MSRVKGRFHHDKERYLYAPSQRGLGWHVYTPLEWAPAQLRVGQSRLRARCAQGSRDAAAGQVTGEVEITGLLRVPPSQDTFTPANDVARNLWYWPDMAAMQASAFRDGQRSALPFTIDADARPEPPGACRSGGVTRLDLPNRHLEYALTWYGLALTLIGVYCRLRPRPAEALGAA